MQTLSFRNTLLLSFLLIVAVLGAAAVSSALTLEDFAARSHAGARNAVGLSAAVQRLGERTVNMERSARQYLVLEDPILLERFAQARDESLAALLQMAGLDSARELVLTWRATSGAALDALEEGGGSTPILESLDALVSLNERLADAVNAHLEESNRELRDELDRNRRVLAWQVAIAIVAASALAAVTGWWVLRPLGQVEKAIGALGESRYDRPFLVTGPADLRQLGQRIEWLRLRLGDLEANRTRVLRHVSHELKTPLASLREGVALLRDGVAGELNGQQREVAAILDHNARALQEHIEGLLGYNAAVFDARRLKRQPIALPGLLESVIAEQRLPIEAKGLDVRVIGGAPTICADPDKLRIVFNNLLTNAISFSPPGGEIRLEVTPLAGGIRVDCVDQGPGVEPEDAERIFDPFFQGSRQPEEPRHGSGLGLSIVREFVTAHGGRVELLPGPGARFRMELPHGS